MGQTPGLGLHVWATSGCKWQMKGHEMGDRTWRSWLNKKPGGGVGRMLGSGVKRNHQWRQKGGTKGVKSWKLVIEEIVFQRGRFSVHLWHLLPVPSVSRCLGKVILAAVTDKPY